MHIHTCSRRCNRQMAADPISLAIGAQTLLGSAALFTSAAGVTLFTTSVSLATTVAIGLAVNLASQALAGANRQSALTGGQGVSVGDQGLRVPVRQAIPPQRLVLGTVTASGALFFQRSDPPYIWLGYEIASHQCGAFLELILNGIPVELLPGDDGTLLAATAPFFDSGTSYIEISYRDGDPEQLIDPIIARDFPDMPSTFRQRGHATVVVKANYGATDTIHKDIYGSEGNFNPLFRFQGARVPDPRVPNFDAEDESTWVQGSSNASLAMIRYLLHPWPNMRLIEPSMVDWDRMKVAAAIDDRWTGLADGTLERNHTADGVIFSTDDPFDTCKRLLTAFDGLLVNDGGSYYTLPGIRREPVATIHQDMIAGGFEMQTEAADRDVINIVKTEMIAPEREYNTVVGPVLRRDDLIAQDGRALETTLSLPFTEGAPRAQRLASRKLIESRNARSLSMVLTVEAADRSRFRVGNIVRVDLRDFPEIGGIFQIRKIARDMGSGKVHVDLVAWSNERFDWHAPDDQQAFELDEDVLAAEAA